MKRRHGIGLLAVAGALLLSGCGQNSGSPGAAVAVDGKVITMAHVNEIAQVYCKAQAPQLQGQQVPMSAFRDEVAAVELLDFAAHELADERDVQPSDSYAQQVAQNRQAIGELDHLDENDKNKLIDVLNGGLYAQSIADSLGLQELGVDDPTKVNPDEATAAGYQVIYSWLQDHNARFSPSLGYGFDEDGRLTQVDSSLSVPVSDFAQIRAKNLNPDVPQAQPDYSFLDELPASASCTEG